MLSDLAKATIPVQLRGTTYEISPLTIGDMGQLCRVLQYAPYTSLLEFGDAIPKDELLAARIECSKKPVSQGSQDFQRGLDTETGRIEAAYLSLKHKHNLTREELKSWLALEIELVVSLAVSLTIIPDNDSKKKAISGILERFGILQPNTSTT